MERRELVHLFPYKVMAMKKLLASCSLFAVSLCYFQSQAQAQLELPAAPGKHAEARKQLPLYSEVQIGTKTETTFRVWPETQEQVSRGPEAKETPGVQHRHLLVAKVPNSYNGHLLIKTPDKKMRHLRVFPNPDTSGSKAPDIAKPFLIPEKPPKNDRSED
ncbi:hypothetical protein EDD80_10931 [Anseongella ginsenosidimutans]|uniref:Uncharacterized protein n=1 Tax=Anseongella ginsenosidimutans TaxID=496056 RepID=A0A4R3KPZ3_9SPHI|nr:hypothetical protein [Anseongella ginsenosidimutans]QEC53738.1 hypothetical protein FRZ59_16270 [Anseongella ginsenosidimutans]TCS86006.1 hypothetical protein EDD80_10931 [Anseongella ginsenosidimutans]